MPYNLKLTALSHGWVRMAPFRWDESRSSLERIEVVGQKTLHCRVAQLQGGDLEIIAEGHPSLAPCEDEELRDRFTRALSVQEDLTAFRRKAELEGESGIVDLINAGGGRLLRGTSLLEDAIKTVFTCNASWEFSKKMAKSACEMYGDKCLCCGVKSFPKCEDWPTEIDINIGYRKRTIRELVRKGPYIESLASNGYFDELRAALQAINGIGPYSESHIMCLAGDYSRIPVDREVAFYLDRDYSRSSLKLIQDDFCERWGKWSFLAYKAGRIAAKQNWIG